MTPTEFKTMRGTLGFTQAQLAAFLGFRRDHIAKLESGDREITRPVELVMLALRDGWKYQRHIDSLSPSSARQS